MRITRRCRVKCATTNTRANAATTNDANKCATANKGLQTEEKNMPPYEYGKMNERQRKEALDYRDIRKLPLHEPPHVMSIAI